MHYTLLLTFVFISWFATIVGALSISFPSGTIVLDKSVEFNWTHAKDANTEFFLQKIKLDEPGGPGGPSGPVTVDDSTKDTGKSHLTFTQAGLFEVLAVNPTNTKSTLFMTEVTVASKATLTSTAQHSPITSSTTSTSTTKSSTPSPTGKTDMETNPPNSGDSSKATTFAIVGGIAGGVGVLLIIGAILLFLRYRARRRTSQFFRNKMAGSYGSEDRWVDPTIVGLEKEQDISPYYSPIKSKRASLLPQDSVSNIALPRYVPPILPPIPTARSITSSNGTSSASSSSSVRRMRDNNTPRLSITTLSASASNASSGSGTLFPIPALPPRTRTDRQMVIEEDIQRLQARMLMLQGGGDMSPITRLERQEELTQIYAKVEKLKKVHESKWALGLTDDIPEELF